MTNFIKNFANDESGAVTVDWVVLTAAIVGLGIGVIGTLAGSSTNVASNISSEVADIKVGE
jgi:Flp pilus assembly pilin Flp